MDTNVSKESISCNAGETARIKGKTQQILGRLAVFQVSACVVGCYFFIRKLDWFFLCCLLKEGKSDVIRPLTVLAVIIKNSVIIKNGAN